MVSFLLALPGVFAGLAPVALWKEAMVQSAVLSALATLVGARVLGAEEPIRCLEAFDIAHLRGGETVASKVCFIDGKPFKEGYRRYKIQTVANDDFNAMREVVSRRYRDAGEGEELYPDLILIDGGIGQLNAALDAFTQLRVQLTDIVL